MRIVDPQRGKSYIEKRGRRALVRWDPAGERKWMVTY
jgi:hypothetical protein